MKVLVTGGAGYIGSHMLSALKKHNYEAVCFDKLSTGHRDLVCCDNFIEGDLANKSLLSDIFANNNFDAVIHFAGSSQVGESINQPDKYYRNNITNTQNLLDVMIHNNVKKFVFSSTAAIFGNPQYIPINEDHLCNPINPYGRSKLLIEHMLDDYDVAYDLKSVALRYFNAAGADSRGLIGERHIPETHLIPLVLQTASGRKKDITIFGNDYETDDGTCVRDFIHVNDVADAHIKCIPFLKKNISKYYKFNIGTGEGVSILELVDQFEKSVGISIPYKFGKRRLGDVPELWANCNLAKKNLEWKVKYSLHDMIISAWNWERKLKK